MNCIPEPNLRRPEALRAGAWQLAVLRRLACLPLVLLACFACAAGPDAIAKNEEVLVTSNPVGQYSGRLTVALRTEPKTLNPVTALDGASRDVIGRMVADLVHINRETQQTEPALAKS